METFELLCSNDYIKSVPNLEALLYFLYLLISDKTNNHEQFIKLYKYFHIKYKTEQQRQAYDEILKLVIKNMSMSDLMSIDDSVLTNKFFLSYENENFTGIYTKYTNPIITITKFYNIWTNQLQKINIDNVIYALEECTIEDLKYFNEKILEDVLFTKCNMIDYIVNNPQKILLEYLEIMDEDKSQLIVNKFCTRYKNNKSNLKKINSIFKNTIKQAYVNFVNETITNLTIGSKNIMMLKLDDIICDDNTMLQIMENNEDHLKCKICYEKMISKVCKDCGNTICEQCYLKLNSQIKSTCPYCVKQLCFFNVRLS